MPARYRKSVKIGGMRVNVNKKSVSISDGGNGLRYTVNSKGRRTTTVGAPGTGLSYTKTTSVKRPAAPRATRAAGPARTAVAAPPRPVKPGLFAPKAEKTLYRAISAALGGGQPQTWMPDFDAAAERGPLAFAAHSLAGLVGVNSEPQWALPHLDASYAAPAAPEADPFITRYVHIAGFELSFTGISFVMPLSHELVGILLAKLHEDSGDIASAVAVAESLPHTRTSVLVRADLAVRAGSPERAVALTNGVTNTDDFAVAVLATRAEALRACGHLDAALEVTKEGLRYPSRAAVPRQQVRIERAKTYLALGQCAKAKGEAERVRAENAAHPALAEFDRIMAEGPSTTAPARADLLDLG